MGLNGCSEFVVFVAELVKLMPGCSLGVYRLLHCVLEVGIDSGEVEQLG